MVGRLWNFISRVSEGVLAQGISLAIMAAGAVMIGLAQSLSTLWAQPILYGLVAFAALLVIFNQLRQLNKGNKTDDKLKIKTSRNFSQSEAERIEEKIRVWLDMPNWEVARQPSNDKLFFQFKLTVANTVLNIFLKRESPFIWVVAAVEPSSNFLSLPQEKKEDIMQQLQLHLLHTDVQYDFREMPNFVRFAEPIPFTDDLTQYEFTRRLRAITDAVQIAMVYLYEMPKKTWFKPTQSAGSRSSKRKASKSGRSTKAKKV